MTAVLIVGDTLSARLIAEMLTGEGVAVSVVSSQPAVLTGYDVLLINLNDQPTALSLATAARAASATTRIVGWFPTALSSNPALIAATNNRATRPDFITVANAIKQGHL